MSVSLERVSRGRIPLAEVSGLDCAVRESGAILVALGDTRASVAIASVQPDGVIGEWEVSTAKDFGAAKGADKRFAQLEAVALDGGGRAWVLTEGTSLLGGIDLAARTAVGAVALDTSTIPELHEGWSQPGASRGEGLLLLERGHVLVAQEKDPAGLVEFGPAGDSPLGVTAASVLAADRAFDVPAGDLVALAWWLLRGAAAEDFADLSDLATDSAGNVWVLSDQSRRLGRLHMQMGVGDDVVVTDVVDLPKKTGKPEGLAFLPGGLLAVADDRDDDEDNLWVFRAPGG